MPKPSSDGFTGWTIPKYREFMKDNYVTAKERDWDAGILRNLDGQCMVCGCPKDDYHMKISTSPYNCSLCEKKTMSEEEYQKRMERIAFVQDEIHPQGSRAIFAFVKRTLLHGFSIDPVKFDKIVEGELDGTEERTPRTPLEG